MANQFGGLVGYGFIILKVISFRNSCRNSQLIPFLVLAVLTFVFIGFTIFYSYNATLGSPVSRRLLPSNPSSTILIINIISHVTVALLQLLTSSLFEAVRWVFAMKNGVPSFTMLSLSPGTGILGVLYLLFSRSEF